MENKNQVLLLHIIINVENDCNWSETLQYYKTSCSICSLPISNALKSHNYKI